MDDARRPEAPVDGGKESSPPTPMGTAAIQPSWKDLQAEFLQHAAEHADLSAVWIWMYPERTYLDAFAEAISMGEGVEPLDVLKRMYEQPDVSGRPPAPTGQWNLEGGSPAAQDLFRVIAGRAAGRLPNPSGAEPWRLWLDRMRAEGYAPERPVRRVFAQEVLRKPGQILGPYPEGFEDRHIEHVFKASADFCFVRSIAETATPNPAALGTMETGAPARLVAIPPHGMAQGTTAKPKNIESLKAGIDDDINALVKQQQSTPALAQQAARQMGGLPPPRTFNLNDPFEADLFSVLERGARELTESAAAEAVQQQGEQILRPSKRSVITEPIYSFLADRWLNTGFDFLRGAPGAGLRAAPTLSRLRQAVNRTLTNSSLTRERTRGTAPNARNLAPMQPASAPNTETWPASDPHRSVPPDSVPQTVEGPGSSDKSETGDVIKAPEIFGEMRTQSVDLPNVTDSPAPGSEQAKTPPPERTPPKARKTPSERLTEYKVSKKIKTQELVAEKLGLERSVYFDLKAGKRVSEETYIKAALAIGCSPDDLKP